MRDVVGAQFDVAEGEGFLVERRGDGIRRDVGGVLEDPAHVQHRSEPRAREPGPAARLVYRQSLSIGCNCHEDERPADRALPRAPVARAPAAPGDLPPALRRRRASHGRVPLRARAGGDAHDVAQDRVPDGPRSRGARRGRRARSRYRLVARRLPTSSTRTITSCAAAAAGFAISRSSSTVCGCPAATAATSPSTRSK